MREGIGGAGGRTFDVLIVGAGHAGAQTAIALRQLGFEGAIALLGDEPDLPYERPPLSKDYLAGEKPFERMLIRPASFWDERAVTLLPGMRVVSVDPDARHVLTECGHRLGYRELVWATGGAPRRLSCPGADLTGIHAVRDRADVDRMITELPAVRTVAVIGGGFVGLEAAAVLRKAGKQVHIVETQGRVLGRAVGEAVSRFYESEHRAQGAVLHLARTVERIEGKSGQVAAIQLSGGERIECEMVVAGIGILPSVSALLAAGAAGAAGGDGVDVDEQCRTSLPNVHAIGDCARHANRYAGGARIRLESVQNAVDQAMVAARDLQGIEARYDAVPWFWSNQYDLKLQTVGLALGHDQAVLRGDPATRAFSVVYLRQGKVIALDCVNALKDFVQGKLLVVAGSTPDLAQLADTGIPLKELAGN